MSDAVLGVLIGLVSGFLAGQFGTGGGLITTPAIRLLLGRPALVAVGTPLPIIIPTAIVGALSDLKLAATMTLGVVPGTLLGARVTQAAREDSVRIAFAVLLLVSAASLVASESGLL